MKKIITLLIMCVIALSSVLPLYAANGKVTYSGNAGDFVFAPGSDYLLSDLCPNCKGVMPGDTVSKIVTVENRQAEAWVRQVGTWLKKGAALLIDYGFPQREYYHPQRATGTLMCHFRHHAHSEPLVYAGLQDITTHIDFTAMADAALDGGLEVLGYTTQARFLMNAGLADALSGLDPTQAQEYAAVVGPVQKLVSESEMGELFKVLAIGRGIDEPLLGFTSGDRRHRRQLRLRQDHPGSPAGKAPGLQCIPHG